MSSSETHTSTTWDDALDAEFKQIIALHGTPYFAEKYHDYHTRLERYREPSEAKLDEMVALYHQNRHIWEDELGYEHTDAQREKLYHLLCAASARRALRWAWHTNQNKAWYANPRNRHL